MTIILCLIITFAHAQSKTGITGSVKDSTDVTTAITYATVIARSGQSNRVLGYTNTDSLGRYRLSVPFDSAGYRVSARFIGYKKKEQVLLPNTSGTDQKLDFLLVPEGFQLDEVVIEGRKARVRISGDTTSYEVEAFASGAEENIEDLLNKLPGVTVGQDGVLFFKGKRVEAVMIDGEDLLGDNYMLATRNARADLLAEVQAIENFHENPLLKDIEGGDGTVLNLTIKDSRKSAAFGNASLHYGNAHTREAKVNVFSYLKGLKAFTTAGHNNIGNSNGPAIQLSGSLSELQDALEERRQRLNPFLSQGRIMSESPLPNRDNFNNEWVGSTSLAVEAGERSKIKLSLVGKTDKLRRSSFEESNYFTEQPFTVATNSSREYLPTTLRGELSLTSMLSDKDRLLSETAFKYESVGYENRSIFQAGESREVIGEVAESENVFFQQKIYYTHRFKGYKALLIHGNYQYGSLPQLYEAASDSSRYNDFFGLTRQPPYSMRQQVGQKQHLGLVSLKLPVRVNNSLYTLHAKMRGRWQSLNAETQLLDTGREDAFRPEGFQSDMSDRMLKTSVEGSYEYDKGAFHLTANLEVNYLNRYVDRQYGGSQQASWLYLIPEIIATARLSAKARLRANYSYDFQPRDLSRLLTARVFKEFRSIQIGLEDFIPEQNHTVSLAFLYKNQEKAEDFLLRVGYGINQNSLGSQVEVNEDFQIYKPLLLGENQFGVGKIAYIRFIDWLGLNIDLSIDGRITQRETLINNQKGEVSFYGLAYKIGFGKLFGDFASIGTGVTINQQILESDRGGEQNTNANTFAEGFLNSEFSYKKKSLKLEGSWVQLNGELLTFLDVIASWKVSKKTTLYLTGQNLTGLDEYRQVNLLDYVNDLRGVALTPRRVLVGVNWSF